MERVWRALVRDPRRAVTRHLPAILDELVAASQGASFREREAACLALQDALGGGRSFGDVAPQLMPLWRACLRAVDDVKDSVREAGLGAMRALGALSMRLCSPSLTPARDARAAVGLLLPFLLAEGVTSAVRDAQRLSLRYLAELAKAAGPALRPHVPALALAALQSLSQFEPEGFAFAQQHVDGGSGLAGSFGLEGVSQERLELARIAAARASPLADALERCAAQLAQMSFYELEGERESGNQACDVPAGDGRAPSAARRG